MLRLVIEAIGIRPVEVPHRVTALRVQWQSGHITELTVPRPDRAQRMRTTPAAVARLRELAQTGLRDEQIAEQLNAEGFVTGKERLWTAWAIRWARRKEGIERHYPDRPRRTPLPKRHPDGRYSVEGVAERFGVSIDQVRRWIERTRRRTTGGLRAAPRRVLGPSRSRHGASAREAIGDVTSSGAP